MHDFNLFLLLFLFFDVKKLMGVLHIQTTDKSYLYLLLLVIVLGLWIILVQ